LKWRKNIMPKNQRPPLTVVDPTAATTLTPPRTLNRHGRALWDRIQAEYRVDDCAGVEMLTQACQALDRAEALADQIASDGEVIRGRNGMLREHPCLKAELANRAFVVRTLTKLGLNYEPVKAKGRPPFWAAQE
jgi:hypothetical protein